MSLNWEESRMEFLSKCFLVVCYFRRVLFWKVTNPQFPASDHQACSQLQNHESLPSQRSIKKVFQETGFLVHLPKDFTQNSHCVWHINSLRARININTSHSTFQLCFIINGVLDIGSNKQLLYSNQTKNSKF